MGAGAKQREVGSLQFRKRRRDLRGILRCTGSQPYNSSGNYEAVIEKSPFVPLLRSDFELGLRLVLFFEPAERD